MTRLDSCLKWPVNLVGEIECTPENMKVQDTDQGEFKKRNTVGF